MACGVLGIVLNKESGKLGEYAQSGLSILNHRGEASHGFTFQAGSGLETRKSMGLVKDSRIFDKPISGKLGIGHTRYTTSSGTNIQNAQPIQLSSNGVEFAISHNGNIANSNDLKAMLRMDQKGISDTWVLGTMLGNSVCARELNPEVVKAELNKLMGSYSLVMAVAGPDPRLVAMRDPSGYMPLFIGSNQDGLFVASESVAFDETYLNAVCEPIMPGQMVVISKQGRSTYQLLPQRAEHCMFQYIYMCRPDSDLEGGNVYEVRERLGMRIAEHYKPKVDFLIPVPESGRAVAYGYNQVSKIPIREGLVKDRYASARSFMQEGQANRQTVIRKKLNVIQSVVKGKSVLILDDSLVRSLTSTNIIRDLKAAGAAEVHVALSCPQVISECHYGIDFYNDQLVARQYGGPREAISIEIAKRIGAASVYYPSIDDLVWAIGLPRSEICLSCLTGEYSQNVKTETEERRKS